MVGVRTRQLSSHFDETREAFFFLADEKPISPFYALLRFVFRVVRADGHLGATLVVDELQHRREHGE